MSEAIKNNVPKWYKKMKVWHAITAILTTIASGEALMYFKDIELPSWVHVVVGICGAILILLKLFVKDDNNDGIVD